MPDLSMFPTDNLYKFLALSGVALVVLAFYVGEKVVSRYERQIDRLSLTMARTKILNTLQSRAKLRIDLVKSLAAIGGGIAMLGFMGWYFQLQRPQDTLLRMQVQAAIDSAHAHQAK